MALTTAEAAEQLGISLDTASRWYDLGLLRGHRLPGGRGARRIDPASVEELRARQGMPRAAGVSPSEWLSREISSGRLSAVPADELLTVIAEAIRGSTKCAAGGSTSPAALGEGTVSNAASP